MTKKYPRTPHFPFSPGATSDDRMLSSFGHLVGVPVVITEKMDGSNLSMSREFVFARSHGGSPQHRSFDLAKSMHAAVRHNISAGVSVFGEYVYALHSIPYVGLPGFFLVFGVREDTAGIWWAWEMVKLAAAELSLPTVPELWAGTAKSEAELQGMVEHLALQSSLYGPQREGVVVRVQGAFLDEDFPQRVAKWVRAGHVQTDEHWTKQRVVPNRLAGW